MPFPINGVIRDDLIAAVGANVAGPADARQITGAGLVYPGLIDAAMSRRGCRAGGAA